jgi:predicted tellurium resistance membrane protein TerC
VRTILLADLVMSLDNVLAVAAAAQGNTLLLVIGLAVSIPLIVFGSTLILKLMERFPLIITAGAALLGWLAGEMMLTDPAIHRWFGEVPESAVRIARRRRRGSCRHRRQTAAAARKKSRLTSRALDGA